MIDAQKRYSLWVWLKYGIPNLDNRKDLLTFDHKLDFNSIEYIEDYINAKLNNKPIYYYEVVDNKKNVLLYIPPLEIKESI